MTFKKFTYLKKIHAFNENNRELGKMFMNSKEMFVHLKIVGKSSNYLQNLRMVENIKSKEIVKKNDTKKRKSTKLLSPLADRN